MSFVGKLLVVLQVVLSVCFMAFAGAVFATHTNWKDKNAQTQQDLDTARKEITALNTRNDQLTADLEETTQKLEKERDTLLAQVQNLTAENDAYKARQNEHENHANVAQETSRIALQDADARHAEAMALRKENNIIHESRHEELQRRLELENLLKAEQEKTAMLNERVKTQLRDIAVLTAELRRNDLVDDPKEIARRQAPPQDVDGRVERVSKDRRGLVNLLEINIGSDDGLVKGHTLYVYRGGKYLGEVKVVQTSPDVAVAEFVSGPKNGIIQEGDYVTTKL